jgi:hypothetical protein
MWLVTLYCYVDMYWPLVSFRGDVVGVYERPGSADRRRNRGKCSVVCVHDMLSNGTRAVGEGGAGRGRQSYNYLLTYSTEQSPS